MNSAMDIIFIIISVLIISAAVFILFSKNVVYSAFLLFFVFIGVAAVFVFANADFLAVAQIMIYIGGILILIVFGILLTNKPQNTRFGTQNTIITNNQNAFLGLFAALILMVGLFFVLFNVPFQRIEGKNFEQFEAPITTVQSIGLNLIANNSLPFEAVGVLLIGALIGAGYIAKSTLDSEK